MICPPQTPYSYENRCVERCPYYLINNTCYEKCPFNQFGYKNNCILHCPQEANYTYKMECFAACPNQTIIDAFQFTCSDTCPHGKFVFERSCIDKCPSHAPYIFNFECVKTCKDYLDGKYCFKQCPSGKFGYKGKCVSNCPSEAKFANGSVCVKQCPIDHDYKYNCIDHCNVHMVSKEIKCKSDCNGSLPFFRSFIVGVCTDKCDDYELATEDYTCIIKTFCSDFIDDKWCRKQCPAHTYILRNKQNHCKPLITVYVMILILFLIVAVNGIFVISVVHHWFGTEKVCFAFRFLKHFI